MSGYVMHCTLCKTNHPTLTEWNDHLLTTYHQSKAKVDLWQWGEEERKCSIVIYSSFVITALTVKNILQYFSNKRAAMIVTDIVMSTSRTKIAIMQFESRKKVKEMMSFVGGPTIKIEGQLVQLRCLNKMLHLEWQELLSDFQDSFISPNCRVSIEEANFSSKSISVTSSSSKSCSKSTVPLKECGITLTAQLHSIVGGLKIPDLEFNIVTDVMKEIKKLLEDSHPMTFTVGLYRNNYLQLRNNIKCKKYLVYIYVTDEDNHAESFYCPSTEFKQFGQLHLSPDSTHLADQSILSRFSVQPGGVSTSDTRKHIRHKDLDIEINFSTYPFTLSEQRLSCLVKYYCSIDSRIKQLLSCVYYWAQINGIHLAKRRYLQDSISWRTASTSVPEPAALEWILLFFLCHKEKLIPTPKEVLNQPHKIIKFKFEAVDDLGFSEDPLFGHRWKQKQKRNKNMEEYPEDTEEYTMSIVKILRKFFLFYSENLFTPCVLNTSDGTAILGGSNAMKKYKHNLASLTPEGFSRLVLTHPLMTNWVISVDSTNWHQVVVPSMKVTSQKLEKFINMLEKCPDKITRNDNLLKDVFSVE